jgi:hypothetical protein
MSEDIFPARQAPSGGEIAYNSVARNARLTQLGVLLNELVSDTPKEMLKGETLWWKPPNASPASFAIICISPG